jgi:hypothetical protein
VNRRSFLAEALKAATVFTILPGAGRLWVPVPFEERVPFKRGVLQIGFGPGVEVGFRYRLRPGEVCIQGAVDRNVLEQYEKTHRIIWDDPIRAAKMKVLLKEWTRETGWESA